MRTSTGDAEAQDEERQDHIKATGLKEVMTVERDLKEPGTMPDLDQRKSAQGVEGPEVARKGSVFVQGNGNGEDFHAFTSLSCSSSSSSCPSPSALLSTLSLCSSSSKPSFTPPLAPSTNLDAVLVDGRLVLDVYQRGGTMMPALWESAPERMKLVQYVRLGSEDEEAMEDALSVLPHLTQLRSLAIRGRHTNRDMFSV